MTTLAEKKMPGRFTVQFNMNDPQQREAAVFLERQGRRKAQIITNAVLHYLSCDKAASLQAPERGLLESGLLEMICKAMGEVISGAGQEVSSQKKESTPPQAVDYSAIEQTMLAFDQQ